MPVKADPAKALPSKACIMIACEAYVTAYAYASQRLLVALLKQTSRLGVLRRSPNAKRSSSLEATLRGAAGI